MTDIAEITADALASAAGVSSDAATRLLPVVKAMAAREVNNTDCPQEILNEAYIRLTGWMGSHADHTRVLDVSGMRIEYSVQHSAPMRLSGARSLLAPYRRHRTTTIRAKDAREES